MSHDAVAHCYNILRQFETAMLITHSSIPQQAELALRARPMAIAQVDDNGDIWFLTGRHSGKVDDIAFHHDVHVTCQRDRDFYLSLSGRANLVDDRNKLHSLWKEVYKTWFPDGIDDPDITLIRVQPISAEYWDNSGTKKIQYAIESIKAYLTGTKPLIEQQEHHAILRL